MSCSFCDTSWEHALNPDNAAWVPGYRFYVMQPAKVVGRSNGRMRTRQYRVHFRISRDGDLEWAGGVKPTEHTQGMVERLYAKGRPGSNGAPV